ncbi:MAG: DUF1566 domain-containing protein [Leptospira sp.]|nr:DUF1566 domain-containing protein [Leptospira sp.]
MNRIKEYSKHIMLATGIVFLSVGCNSEGNDSLFDTAATATFTLGGNVTGLTGTLVLTNDGVDKSITANGAYTFDTAVNSGSTYNVTVKTQPSGQTTCTVSNGTGTASANVSNINVSCVTPCLNGEPGGTETYAWGTFTDQCDGTIQFAGTAGTFGGQTYTAQTLIFTKCTHGQTYNSTTNDCTGTGNEGNNYGATQVQFCDFNNNSCNGETDTGTLDDGGTSGAWTACDNLNFAGKTDWRVPTRNELKTLIHCNNKTMPNNGFNCGEDNFTNPVLSFLFPNTHNPFNIYWTSTSFTNTSGTYVRFDNGLSSGNNKNQNSHLRCVHPEPI